MSTSTAVLSIILTGVLSFALGSWVRSVLERRVVSTLLDSMARALSGEDDAVTLPTKGIFFSASSTSEDWDETQDWTSKFFDKPNDA